jgi:hypothetical protein
MTLNASGPISLGGTTPGQSIALELNGPGTAQITLNDANVRTLAGVPSGAIIMPTNFYGKSNRVTINLVISANTQSYDVFNNRGPTYVSGTSDLIVTVNPGVNVGATNTGSYAMLVPSSFSPGDTVTIVNNGNIVGAGGNGGAGGPVSTTSATSGSSGGNALYINRPTTITNNNNIGAGGGGGGGGGCFSAQPRAASGGGGGGGGGAGNATGSGAGGGTGRTGLGGSQPGGSGSPGSATSGGSGGGGGGSVNPPAGPGGPGGGLGSPGSGGSPGTNIGFPALGNGAPGGGSANYVVGSAFVTWPATGNRYGGAS